MSHQLVLDLPDEVYEPLAKIAHQSGTPQESLAVAWLTSVSRQAANDPIEGFIGALRGDVPDWADRHDAFLGQAQRDRSATSPNS